VDIRKEKLIVLGRSHLREGVSACILKSFWYEIRTSIKLALVVNHEHHLPFKYIVVIQAAGDARDVFISLHLFKLTGK
jgi:hypothetical protein